MISNTSRIGSGNVRLTNNVKINPSIQVYSCKLTKPTVPPLFLSGSKKKMYPKG